MQYDTGMLMRMASDRMGPQIQATQMMTEPQRMNALRQEIKTLRIELQNLRPAIKNLPQNEARDNAFRSLSNRLDNAEIISKKFPLKLQETKRALDSFKKSLGLFQVLISDEKKTGSEPTTPEKKIAVLRNDVYAFLAKGQDEDAKNAFNHYNEIGRIYYDKLGSGQLIGEGPSGELGPELKQILDGQRKLVFKHIEEGNLAAAKKASDMYAVKAYYGLNMCRFEQGGIRNVLGKERSDKYMRVLKYGMNALAEGKTDDARRIWNRVEKVLKNDLKNAGKRMMLGKAEDYNTLKNNLPKLNDLENAANILKSSSKVKNEGKKPVAKNINTNRNVAEERKVDNEKRKKEKKTKN